MKILLNENLNKKWSRLKLFWTKKLFIIKFAKNIKDISALDITDIIFSVINPSQPVYL